MESEKIQKLIEKYWNCETSLEEEKVLREFFSSGEIPEDLKKYKPLFHYFSEKRNEKLSQKFEERILNKISDNESEEGRQRYFGNLYKVAAAIVLILSIFFINQWVRNVNQQAKEVMTDTFEDPEKALEETKKILYLVSEKLKIGKQEASKLSKFKKAEEVVKNTNYKEI